MRIFEHFPTEKECPICNSNYDSKCWLMVIDGTEEGSICEATPVHVDCTGEYMIGRMRYNKTHGIVYCFCGA
jgi:hypothetical protein